MTTIVTADKLVTALAQRVNAGADTSVSGPNKQLKDAMVAKNFFSGGGGPEPGGGGGLKMEFAYGEMVLGQLFTQARPLQVISKAQLDTYVNADRDWPRPELYKDYRWDTVSNNSALGGWVSNNRFVFAKRCYATVTAQMSLLLMTQPGTVIDNLVAHITTGNTSNPQGRFTGAIIDRNYHPSESAELGIAQGSTTYSRWFDPNDYVEFKYLAVSRTGIASAAYYGSMRNIESRVEIVGFTGM